jgi:anhydro-N-acetylmuramic acid kinase
LKVVGVMSGTSYDAIETAAAEFRLEDEAVIMRPLGSRSEEYDPDLRSAIAGVLPSHTTSAEDLCKLDTRLGQAFAEAAFRTAEEFCRRPADLVVSHGQTVFHWVKDGTAMGTLQLGEPAWIAERTGSPVVSDLRSRDVAVGGQGAPLASLFDVLLLAGGSGTRAALNLGGIANMTIVAGGRKPEAYDVGPANALIDASVQHITGGREAFDRDGHRAACGKVNERLLERLLSDPYYEALPPKSTGKEHFNLPYLLQALDAAGSPGEDDVVATLTALTARTVAREAGRWDVSELVVSGGGTANPTLMAMLREDANPIDISTTERWGIPSSGKEAYAFALMGFFTFRSLPANVPSCTGAGSTALLGNITPGRSALVLPAPAANPPSRLVVESSASRTESG